MSKENKSRYALLGMLSLGPMSGYDLKKSIEYSIGNFWNESYPQIYPILKQLSQEGLTTSHVERQEGRPERHVYSLTEKGWEELRNWLKVPFEPQILRSELLLKLFFGAYVPPDVDIEHVRRCRAMQLEELHQLEQIEAEITERWPQHPQLPYWLMTVNHGKHVARALIAWCDETLPLLEGLANRTEPATTQTKGSEL